MDLQSQRLELIEWLAGINDSSLINQFVNLKNKVEIENDKALKQSLERGLKEVQEGKTTPHKEVMKNFRNKYSA